MPLTHIQEEREYELRIEQMQTNIEKMRTDMAALQKQLQWENRKFFIQFAAVVAAALGAGVALANYVNSRPPAAAPPAPPPQIIYIQPIAPAPAPSPRP